MRRLFGRYCAVFWACGLMVAAVSCRSASSLSRSPLEANPAGKRMNFISVVAFRPGNVEAMAQEARRAAAATGVNKNAYSMSLMPTGKEPIRVVERYAESFGRLREALRGSNVEAGILVQSLVGHGWAGAATVEIPMEYSVNQLGKTQYRHCMLDANFRKYVWDTMVLLARQHPAFFLMDDDTRLINNSSNGVECFCDSHMKLYNEVLPRKFAGHAELREYLENAPASDPVVVAFEAERRKLLLGFAKMIRDAIDSVDPSIRCGYCSGGGEYLLMGDIARTLAGRNESFLRINDALYLEQWTQDFNASMYHCAFKSRVAGNVDYILDESDTCPHSRYSKSAISMHAHIAGAILNGASGGKLWITNLMNPLRTSTDAYEKIIKKNRLFYDALLAEMPKTTWLGPVTPLVDVKKNFNPARARGGFYSWHDWQVQVLNRYGIPARYEYADGNGVTLLTGDIVDCLDDGELKKILSSAALVDGYAAFRIAERGMGGYLGCVPKKKQYRSSGEFWLIGDRFHTRFQNDFSLPFLDELAAGVEVLSECRLTDRVTGESSFVAPATIFYRNPAGGTVVTRAVATGVNRYNDESPELKAMLLEIFRRMDKEMIPFHIGEEQPVYFRCGKYADGGHLLAMVNLSYDGMEAIDLRTELPVKTVECLGSDGVYHPLRFRTTKDGIVVRHALPCYGILVLRVR